MSTVLSPIPRSKRFYRGLDLFLIWAGGNTCIATIFTGGLIGPKLGILPSILVILVGTSVGGSLLGLVALMGDYKGLPTMVLARSAVSVRGSYVASILNVVQLIGWTSILLYASAEAASQAIKYIVHSDLLSSTIVWVMILGIVELTYTIIGPEKWVWCQRVAVSTLLVVLVYETCALLRYMTKYTPMITAKAGLEDILWGLDMVLATAISWAPLVADYSRFSKSPLGSLLGTFLGYTITSYILYGLGSIAAIYTGAYLGDPTAVALRLGLSVVALIFITISAVTTNLLNLYSAVISTLNIFPRLKYSHLVIVYGLLSIALASYPVFFTYFEQFLHYIASVFIPLVAVLVSTYGYEMLRKVSAPSSLGLLSWIIGIGLYVLCTMFIGYSATLITLIATMSIHYLLLRFFPR